MAKPRSDRQLWLKFLSDMKAESKTLLNMHARMKELGFIRYVELIFRAGAASAYAEIGRVESERLMRELSE
jgi:hypothetical protein